MGGSDGVGLEGGFVSRLGEMACGESLVLWCLSSYKMIGREK